MCWLAWALSILRLHVRIYYSGSLGFETLLEAWQKPVTDCKETRSLDAGSGSEKANRWEGSVWSVHIGKVIPKSHNVNRFASDLALYSFELAEVEMSTALSAM